MLSAKDVVMLIIAGALLVLWLIIYARGYKKANFFDSLSEKEFPLKEIYVIGMEIMDTMKYTYKNKRDRKLRRELEVLYGPKYVDYYMRVSYAQKVTFAFTIFVFAFIMYGLADDILITVVFVVFAAVAYYYFDTLAQIKIQKRSEELLSDFSQVISKLALLSNAGMIFREAWIDTSKAGEGVIYDEMRRSVDEMNNGVSEVDAIFNFGSRCMVPEIKKFASTVIQGLVKGNSELTAMLQTQSQEVWEAKRQQIRRQGEKAASKLMLPMMMMFGGILIMVIVPIFTNMGM